MKPIKFYSNGKLLLSAEYLVVDGAQALAVPTGKGQSLTVKKIEGKPILSWNSWTFDKQCWLEISFSLPELTIISTSDAEKANWLKKLLRAAKELNTSFLNEARGISVSTHLEFPRDWGLGSSSTLINNVAQWANINPFELHFKVSNGSGYDIICAKSNNPILYSTENQTPTITSVHLEKSFLNEVFFVHLNKKQNSSEAVNSYNELKKGIDLANCIQTNNEITNEFVNAKSRKDWANAMEKHEYLISNILQQETVKERLFPMYPHSIKSLGAWGGDFAMVIGTSSDVNYFIEKGYDTVIQWKDMVLQ
jgi:mevalonate kinase